MCNSPASKPQYRFAIALIAIALVGPTSASAQHALRDISAGGGFSCGVTTSETALCWGTNWEGQIGDGTDVHRTLAVAVSNLPGGVASISTGAFHACAVTTAGGAFCWGENNDGQLGNGTLERSHSPVGVSGLASGVVAVVASMFHSCALDSGGGVWCWGYNGAGQLGIGSYDDRRVPVPVSGLQSGVAQIAVGGGHSCARLDDGGLKCWGGNGFGQVGDGTNVPRPSPVTIMSSPGPVVDVSAGDAHSCAVGSDGSTWCWGYNHYGQLGDGTAYIRHSPTPVLGLDSGVDSVAAGLDHSCARTEPGGVLCWGRNKWGELGDGTTLERLSPIEVSGLPAEVAKVSTGYGHSCASTGDGKAWCWGANYQGTLGNGTGYWRPEPRPILSAQKFNTVAAEFDHTCAIGIEGAVYCWGSNAVGQLGDGTLDDRDSPLAVAGLSADQNAIELGFRTSCALSASGAVHCWGRNEFGQLGDGTTEDRSTPVLVSGLGSGVTAISSGERHGCAVVAGAATCWGHNLYGQLGDGSTTHSSTPVAVSGLQSGVLDIAAGAGHSCALTDAGAVWCWGEGAIGHETQQQSPVPIAVSDLSSGVAEIDAGFNHGCALTSSGDALCWGWNDQGQLGNGTYQNSNTPTLVSGLSGSVASLGAGNYHSCAITHDGGGRCWGSNYYGQLGNLGNQPSNLPVAVSSLNAARAISAGEGHSCAVDTANHVLCWGANHHGQLADGFSEVNPLPVSVLPEPQPVLVLLAGLVSLRCLGPRRITSRAAL